MSLGGELKALREKNGYSIQDVVDMTHIGNHILEDLENGDYSRITAPVYGSGFVKILAKFYGIDGTRLREVFTEEYGQYVREKASRPVVKLPPLKYTDRRSHTVEPSADAPARPAVTPSKSVVMPRAAAAKASPVAGGTPPAPAPAESLGELFSDGDLGIRDELPEPIPAPAPAPALAPAEEPAPAVEPAAEPTAAIAAAPAIEPAPTPSAPAPVLPASYAAQGESESQTSPAPAPARAAAQSMARLMETLRGGAKDLGTALAQFGAAAVRVASMRKFQRICGSALILILGAWLCLLIAGGGGDEPTTEPAVEPVENPVAAQPAQEAETPVAEVEQPQREQVAIIGTALKDYLLTPPDRYAE